MSRCTLRDRQNFPRVRRDTRFKVFFCKHRHLHPYRNCKFIALFLLHRSSISQFSPSVYHFCVLEKFAVLTFPWSLIIHRSRVSGEYSTHLNNYSLTTKVLNFIKQMSSPLDTDESWRLEQATLNQLHCSKYHLIHFDCQKFRKKKKSTHDAKILLQIVHFLKSNFSKLAGKFKTTMLWKLSKSFKMYAWLKISKASRSTPCRQLSEVPIAANRFHKQHALCHSGNQSYLLPPVHSKSRHWSRSRKTDPLPIVSALSHHFPFHS